MLSSWGCCPGWQRCCSFGLLGAAWIGREEALELGRDGGSLVGSLQPMVPTPQVVTTCDFSHCQGRAGSLGYSAASPRGHCWFPELLGLVALLLLHTALPTSSKDAHLSPDRLLGLVAGLLTRLLGPIAGLLARLMVLVQVPSHRTTVTGSVGGNRLQQRFGPKF